MKKAADKKLCNERLVQVWQSPFNRHQIYTSISTVLLRWDFLPQHNPWDLLTANELLLIENRSVSILVPIDRHRLWLRDVELLTVETLILTPQGLLASDVAKGVGAGGDGDVECTVVLVRVSDRELD